MVKRFQAKKKKGAGICQLSHPQVFYKQMREGRGREDAILCWLGQSLLFWERNQNVKGSFNK